VAVTLVKIVAPISTSRGGSSGSRASLVPEDSTIPTVPLLALSSQLQGARGIVKITVNAKGNQYQQQQKKAKAAQQHKPGHLLPFLKSFRGGILCYSRVHKNSA
jgi:hypothetical protein